MKENKNIHEKGGVPRTKSLTSKKSGKFRNPKGPAKYFQSYQNLQEIELNSIKLPKKYVHDTLNQDVWNDDELDDKILENLKKIALDFYEFLKINAPIEDIWFTGSLANYNWSDYSDIDLHVLIDFDKIDDIEYDFLKEYFDAKKNVWNNSHNIKIKDFEVELYAQDSNELHTSTGVFSILNNEWIKKPNPLDPEIDRELLKSKIQKIVNKIEEIDEITDLEEIQEKSKLLKDKIKKMRQSGLDRGGEFSEENLAFKYLRNNGYIERLFNKRKDAYDKSVSIDENEEPERTLKYNEEINLIPSDEIVDIVYSLHTREEDFEEGDLIERIKSFPFYELKNIPLSSLDTDEFMTDAELVDKYAEEIRLNPDYPPIVFDPINSSIIDGMHRVQSLEQLGHDTVRAYVGRNEERINEMFLRKFVKNSIQEMFSAKGFHASMEDWIDKWKSKGIEVSDFYSEEGVDMGYKRKGLISEDKLEGGMGDSKKPSDFDYRELEIGIAVEKEHTNNKKIAREIALDHLAENPIYYSNLVKKGIVDEKEAIEIYKKYYGDKDLENIEEKFVSKDQQKFFYAMANKPGKTGKKWKEMADEFSSKTDFDTLKEDEFFDKTFKKHALEQLKRISSSIYGMTGNQELADVIFYHSTEGAIYLPIDYSEMTKEDVNNIYQWLLKNGYNTTIEKEGHQKYIVVDVIEPVFSLNESENKLNENHKIYLEKNIKEEHDKNINSLKEFILFCCNNGKIKHPTKIFLRGTRDENLATTASYNPNNHNIHIYCKGRHIVDIMRSIAHELMHMIQMLEDRLYDNSGEDGSSEENEAHSFSGLMIRKFGKLNPVIYENYKLKKDLLK